MELLEEEKGGLCGWPARHTTGSCSSLKERIREMYVRIKSMIERLISPSGNHLMPPRLCVSISDLPLPASATAYPLCICHRPPCPCPLSPPPPWERNQPRKMLFLKFPPLVHSFTAACRLYALSFTTQLKGSYSTSMWFWEGGEQLYTL